VILKLSVQASEVLLPLQKRSYFSPQSHEQELSFFRILQTVYVDTKVIWSSPLIMKNVNSANFTKVMLRNFHIPLIEFQVVLT